MSDEQTKTGTLAHGLTVGGLTHKDFVLREALAGDYFSAEAEATQDKPMSYRAAVLARQLVRVGSFEGPFTLAMIGKLKGKDLAILMDAQRKLDAEGEGEQLGVSTG